MVEFYATYEQGGKQFLAIVTAPAKPDRLRFETRESLLGTMESLGNAWQLRGEMQGTVSDDWLERMAKIGETKPVPRYTDSIFSFGSIPSP